MTSCASTVPGPSARRALRWGGLPVAGLVVLAFLLGPSAVGGEEGGPTMTELQVFCRKLVSSGEITIYPFHVTAEGGVITFDAGDVVACSQSAALCSDPMGVLVRAQCRVELLQRFVAKEAEEGRTESRAFWSPTVEASEKVISAGLADVRRGKHTQGVLLRRAYMALWHVEEIFLLRLLRWADEIQAVVQTLEERGGEVADPCAPPPLPFSNLRSSPPGATIHYMTAIDWDVLSLWKKDPVDAMDQSSDDMLEVPAGVYVVKAVWPGGKTVGPTRLRINGEHIMVKPAD
jgi:hypothetical protein